MKKFSDYVEVRNRFELASMLVENEIDVDAWVKHVINVTNTVELSESEIYNELLGGLRNIAGAGAGMIGRGIGAGAGMVGNAARAGAGMVGNAARAGAGMVGNAAMAGYGQAQNATQAMAQRAQMAGQGLGNLYQQGEQAGKLNQAMKGIDQLEKHLSTMADPKVVNQYLGGLRTELQRMAGHNQRNPGERFRQSGRMSLQAVPSPGIA